MVYEVVYEVADRSARWEDYWTSEPGRGSAVEVCIPLADRPFIHRTSQKWNFAKSAFRILDKTT